MLRNFKGFSKGKYAAPVLNFIVFSCVFIASDVAMATTLGNLATTVADSFSQFAQLMLAISYVAGLGFFIAAIFKFKQHKDNPTQVPVGTPFALLGVAVCLLFLPGFLKPAGTTIFGSKESGASAGVAGTYIGALPGQKS